MTPTAAETRMPAAERRTMILETATALFGDRGYHGTTTDQIAQAAGISQPYVVRMFGTKEKLFLEVVQHALTILLTTFRAILADSGSDRTVLPHRLGGAFVDLIRTDGVHRTLLQAFVLGNDPVIGAVAREGFLDVFRFLRDEAGFEPGEVEDFLAHGMLFSVMVGIEMPKTFGQSADGDELMAATFGEKCAMVIDTMGPEAASRSGA